MLLKLVIGNLQLPSTQSKPGKVSHRGTRNAAIQVTLSVRLIHTGCPVIPTQLKYLKRAYPSLVGQVLIP